MDLEDKRKSKNEASSYVIGGLTVIGLGIGFLFFHISVFVFLGCMLGGLGLGLIIASIMKCKS